jgi:hypothetical protein
MSMKWIRDTYGVPAKRGMLVDIYYQMRMCSMEGGSIWVLAKKGKITSASMYIHVDGVAFHPTYGVVYFDKNGEVLLDTRGNE